jgi:UDP:flavonoid glycosyltransferase YjiC (YdhE family)
MVVLPLFWDQYDNAQRVHELGFGHPARHLRLHDAEMHGAIDRLLGDGPMRTRMAEVASAVQSRSGTERAADLIERVAG